jgi:hypothetical protein
VQFAPPRTEADEGQPILKGTKRLYPIGSSFNRESKEERLHAFVIISIPVDQTVTSGIYHFIRVLRCDCPTSGSAGPTAEPVHDKRLLLAPNPLTPGRHRLTRKHCYRSSFW